MLALYLSMIETDESKNKFEKIYYKYRDLMLYLANRILKEPHLAEDAVHDAFLRLIKYIDNIEDIDCHKTKSLIVIVTESASKDIYNKHKRMVYLENENVMVMEEQFAFQEFNSELICNAIEQLPDLYRDVLMLRYIQGYKNPEIAELLNISNEAVRKRIERAKTKLSEILYESEGEK